MKQMQAVANCNSDCSKQNIDPIAVRAGEAARLLGVSKPTLYEIAKRKDFHAGFKCGGCMLFSVDGLREWVKQQSEGVTS